MLLEKGESQFPFSFHLWLGPTQVVLFVLKKKISHYAKPPIDILTSFKNNFYYIIKLGFIQFCSIIECGYSLDRMLIELVARLFCLHGG